MVNKNIYLSTYTLHENKQSQNWKSLDLSGKRLGVKIEEIPEGGCSSEHHFHSNEEEHVIILKGNGTLILGEQECLLQSGDHICFEAGVELAHHIENRSKDALVYLVFGEKSDTDTVHYPLLNKCLIKTSDKKAKWKTLS